MRIGIGLSRNPDAAAAAAEAVEQAKGGAPCADIALAFGSIRHDQKRLHAELCRRIDPAVLVGGTSYAEITNAGVSQESVAVLLLSLGGQRARFSHAEAGPKPYETGSALARALPARSPEAGGLPLALLFTALASGYENELVRGFTDSAGRMPVFGGMTCGDYAIDINDPRCWVNYQYAGPSLARQSSRLAVLDLDPARCRVGFGFGHGWKPVGPPVELTRCEGHKVYEVGGVPIFDYYRQFLGEAGSDDFFSQMMQRYGLCVLVGEGESRSLMKLPVLCDIKGGCVHFYPAEDLQGRRAQLIQASRQGLISGARGAAERCKAPLGGLEPALVMVVSCCTRYGILHSQVEREVDAVREVFGRGVPVFGYYSGGEIAPFLNGYNEVVDPANALAGSRYHASTLGLMALAFEGGVRAARVPEKGRCALDGARELARLRDLLAKSEEIQDSTESFLANLSRKSYRDAERIRKQNEVIFRYTPHEVWSRIGDSVARGEYELPDSEFNGCFLFLDVKGFTSYSEEHSPAEVVEALNGIFRPATEAIYACGGDVDKFIGDCIFAVFEKPEGALEAGRRLLALFQGLGSRGNPFTVRIGVNSGRAVRANVGSKGRREYTFIGDAVNTAQRLESNCSPGKLLLCEELYKKEPALFPRAERREIALKGKKKKITAYECSL